MRTLVGVSSLMLLLGCVTAQAVPEAANEFVAKGEIRWRGHSASFDAVRVRSPTMNVTKRTDGTWGGTFEGTVIDCDANAETVRGVDFLMSRADSRKDKVVITGQFKGLMYRFELDSEQALVRGPAKSLTFSGRVMKEGVVGYGPAQDFVLVGEAGQEVPPWPQIAFALVAAFR